MQAQAQQGDSRYTIEPNDYLSNDARISLAMHGILLRLSRDAEIIRASKMIQQNPHAGMNAAARFEMLLESAEQWMNNNMLGLSIFDRAAIWHGLVDYRRRAQIRQRPLQQSSTSSSQDVVAEYYVPWHAPKFTSSDSAWPTDSFVKDLELHENIKALFRSTKRLLDLLTPLPVHVLPYITEGKNVMICSGSNFEKTMTLAISAIDFVARSRDTRPRSSQIAPKVLIVVSTTFSFFQLFDCLKQLVNNKKRLGIVVGGMATKENDLVMPFDNVPAGTDIMVATPGRLKKPRKARIDWSRLKLVALHEFNVLARASPEQMLRPLCGSTGTAYNPQFQLVTTCGRSYDMSILLTRMKSLMKGTQLYHISVGCPAYDAPDISYYVHKVDSDSVVQKVRKAKEIIHERGVGSVAILWSTVKSASEAYSIFMSPPQWGNCWLVRPPDMEGRGVHTLRRFHTEAFGNIILNTTIDLAPELHLKPDFMIIQADHSYDLSSSYPAWYKWFDVAVSVGKNAGGKRNCHTFLNPEDPRDRAMAHGMMEVLRSYRKDIPEQLVEIAEGPKVGGEASRKRTASDAGL